MVKRKAEAAVAAELTTPTEGSDAPSNVVYIGRIPHGFYENQMKDYFSQFGRVLKIRMSRNKKTGKSKHYAFIQFQNHHIANIVADAMDGYMFFGQKLQCRVMKRDEVHPELFKGANRVFKKVPWKKIESERHNNVTAEVAEKRAANSVRKDKKRKKRIEEAGIDYDFPMEGNPKKQPKKEDGAKEKIKSAATEQKKQQHSKSETTTTAKKASTKKAAVEKEAEAAPQRVTRARAAATAPTEPVAGPKPQKRKADNLALKAPRVDEKAAEVPAKKTKALAKTSKKK